MGITYPDVVLLSHFAPSKGITILKPGIRMLEFGNQQLFADIPPYGQGKPAKPWFESFGVNHVSVDLNRNNDHDAQDYGCIVADLSTPLDLGRFDVVTDFGTSEHINSCGCAWPTGCHHSTDNVGPLYHARRNAHNACKVGGVMVFSNPRIDHWPDHGFHNFSVEHYVELSQRCGYEIIHCDNEGQSGNWINGHNVVAVLKRLSSHDFIGLDEFRDIYSRTIKPYAHVE